LSGPTTQKAKNKKSQNAMERRRKTGGVSRTSIASDGKSAGLLPQSLGNGREREGIQKGKTGRNSCENAAKPSLLPSKTEIRAHPGRGRGEKRRKPKEEKKILDWVDSTN